MSNAYRRVNAEDHETAPTAQPPPNSNSIKPLSSYGASHHVAKCISTKQIAQVIIAVLVSCILLCITIKQSTCHTGLAGLLHPGIGIQIEQTGHFHPGFQIDQTVPAG